MTEIITEVMLLPDGMEPDDINAHTFAVTVRWRGARTDKGRGGYAVIHGNRHLSHRGKWRWNPEPYLQRHFRWEELDSALVTARSIVNEVRVNGCTWAEWNEAAIG